MTFMRAEWYKTFMNRLDILAASYLTWFSLLASRKRQHLKYWTIVTNRRNSHSYLQFPTLCLASKYQL